MPATVPRVFAGFGTFQVFRIDPHNFDSAIVGCAGVRQRFVDALVGVLQIDVFPDNGDLEIFPGSNDPLDESAPLGHLRGRGIKPEQAADRLVQFFILERERKFVDRVVDVSHLDDGVERNVAEKR